MKTYREGERFPDASGGHGRNRSRPFQCRPRRPGTRRTSSTSSWTTSALASMARLGRLSAEARGLVGNSALGVSMHRRRGRQAMALHGRHILLANGAEIAARRRAKRGKGLEPPRGYATNRLLRPRVHSPRKTTPPRAARARKDRAHPER